MKNYIKPKIEIEHFMANEYVASCYLVKCNCNPISSYSGNADGRYYDEGTNISAGYQYNYGPTQYQVKENGIVSDDIDLGYISACPEAFSEHNIKIAPTHTGYFQLLTDQYNYKEGEDVYEAFYFTTDYIIYKGEKIYMDGYKGEHICLIDLPNAYRANGNAS